MVELGRIGLWQRELRDAKRDAGERLDAVRELEGLGYGALWLLGGSAGREFYDLAESYLAATSRMAVASGILSIWQHTPEVTARATRDLNARFAGRFLLGLGVSHAHIVERLTEHKYEKPLTRMREYLDELAALPDAPPREQMCLAALGPKMLRLSAERTRGAHPYFVPLEHTRQARSILGPGPLLAPEQAVVLETDPARARDAARRHMEVYLRAPNYVNNLKRLGFADAELANGGSDVLVDKIVAWGSADAIRRRVEEHIAAGADHVSLQVVPVEAGAFPLPEWRAIAAVLHDLM